MPPQETSGIGFVAHAAQQRLPFCIGETITVPVGSRVFTAVIEETDIVVFVLNRLDDIFYKFVKIAQANFECLRELRNPYRANVYRQTMWRFP